MLTDKQIQGLIDQKKITIDPFDVKSLKTSRYDVHLGRFILKPINIGEVIDLADPKVQPEYEKIDMSEVGHVVNPGEFLLGQTLEKFALDSDTGMFIDGSSTPARLGVTIHQSSTFVPPGQDLHIITLEMFNAGPWKIKLQNKLRIGKVIFFQSSEKNSRPTSLFNRYNGQSEATGAILKPNNEG